MTYGPGRSWIDSLINKHETIFDAVRREDVIVLTRPRARVISNTKWEVNITRKYQIAPSVMILENSGSFSPCAFAFVAKNIMTKNARESDTHIASQGQPHSG